MSDQDYCEIRCPYKLYSGKQKRYLTCHNLIVRVNPGSSGQAYCWKIDRQNGQRHGQFLFDVDENYTAPPQKIVKIQKPKLQTT